MADKEKSLPLATILLKKNGVIKIPSFRGGMSLKIFLYVMLAAGYAIFFGAMFAIIIASVVIGGMRQKVFTDISQVPELETAVLLGTTKMSADGSEYSILYIYRIDAAAALYLNGKVKKIIVSGNGDDRENKFVENHVFSMKADLIYLGVKPEDIIEDHWGYRTLDSVLRARDTYKVKDPIFVSQYQHCLRAVFQAESNGYNAYGFSRDRVVPMPEQMLTTWREARARVLALLDIFVLDTKARKYDKPTVESTLLVDETEMTSH